MKNWKGYNMSKGKICQPRLIAQSRYCSVTGCPDCKMYHLHVGPFSLRLKHEVFEDICETLLEIYRGHHLQNSSAGPGMRSH